MGKKKSGKKTPATPTTPSAINGGSSDITTSPTASSFAKEDQKDPSEPVQDDLNNATNSTEDNPTGDGATTADAPTAPLSKSQKKKAAAARKAAAALLASNDTPSQPTTEEVATPTEPVADSEPTTNMTKPSIDEPETSNTLETTPAPEPEQDTEGDAWGLNEDEPAEGDRAVTKPAADEAPGAQDSSSADGVQVATAEPKSEDAIPKDTLISGGDMTVESESVPPPPAEETSSDAIPDSSKEVPNTDPSDAIETKNDSVAPPSEVAADEHKPILETTEPNGEPMDLPPRPSDDDNTPLAQIASRKKPIVDTSFVSDGPVNGGARKQTPSSAGENLGSAQSGSNPHTSGTGLFSNSPARPNAPSVSPSSPAVPARGPAAVGFGSGAPPQTPTTTTGFGFGSPQKPKTASGMSWSPSAPSKPAPKSSGWGWGSLSGLANKARETIEQAIADEPSTTATAKPAPVPRAPPARSPSVDRPVQSPAVGPSNSNSNPNEMPASPMKMAALRKKATTGPNKDTAPVPQPETPKASSSTILPSDPSASPISPLQSTQSHTQSHPSPLPLPPSTNTPTEQTAPHTPDPVMVTSALSPPPRETTAETGNVGKLIARFDHPEAPISSKTATTGLRLQTQPPVPDGRRSASPVTKRESFELDTERPSLADMRSSSAPSPKTPINASSKTPGSLGFTPGLGTASRFNASPMTKRESFESETGRPPLADMRTSSAPSPKTPINTASPKTPASFNFGAGLGPANRLNGGGLFRGGGFGLRPNHGPSSISTPVVEKDKSKLENQNDRDDLSSIVESSDRQDMDSQVGEDLDSLVDESGADAVANLPINIDIDSAVIPTAFNTTIPDVAPFVSNPWDDPPVATPEPLPTTTLEVTVPLPSPIKSEFEPEVAIPDDKTIADPWDLDDTAPEPTPKDEPLPESSVASEHVVTPVAEKPAEVPIAEEPVVTPVEDEPPVSPVADEPIVAPVPQDEAPASEPTELAVVPEPLVDEPPPEISTEETPEPVVEQVVEPVVESIVEPTPEPVVESVPKPVVEASTEPTPEIISEPTPQPTAESTPVEVTPEPLVELVVEPLEPAPVPVVEAVSEPVAEPTTVASTLEPSTESFSQPLPPSPIEPPVVESAPIVPTEAPLTVDLKSPLPPTPATPKKKKKAKKGAATASEPAPVIPETISEPAPPSEPASQSEPVSVSEPAPRSPKVEPSVTPTPIEPKVEPIPEIVESAPTVEVPPAPEAPKEPEPITEVVEEEKPKEEPVSSTKGKKSKQKKKRKSSTAPTQATSPTDDVPPTLVETAEEPEAKAVEVAEPAVVEPVVAEPIVAEPVMAEPVVVEPVVVEPTVVEPMVVEHAVIEPIPVEPVSVEPVPVESVVVEPVAEITPSMAVEEATKSEGNRTAIPDKGFETPKVAPQELPELIPEPVEAAPQSPIAEAPVEAFDIASAEPVPEPTLVPLLAEYPEVILTFEAQPEPEPESIAEPVVEPTVDPIEIAIEPSIDVAAEALVEPLYEPMPEVISEPIVEPVAELTIVPPMEDIIAEEILPVSESVPEVEVQTPTEPVVELAVSPVEEAPKEDVPAPEVDANPSPSKSKNKKSKRKEKKEKKDVAQAAMVTEEPPAVEVVAAVKAVKLEDPIASAAEENKVDEEIAKKKGKKSKAISLISTPVEEKAPTLPLPVEAPATLEMEQAVVTVASPVEPLESPVQAEVTPKIEAASAISVVQMLPDIVPIEIAPIEPAPEELPEPEPVPVLVDLPQSPVTSALSVSLPQEAFFGAREPSPPPRSATPNTDKHDEILESPQIPIISAPYPVRPVLEHVVSAEVAAPLSPSPVSESVSQSSRDIGSESHSLRRGGSASSITSIDTDSPSAVEKVNMRPSMPPLISVPVPSPVATSTPFFDSAIKLPSAQTESERKPSTKVAEGSPPSTTTNDLPTNDVPQKPDTTPKPQSSRIFRWFGFGGASSPTEDKSVEVKPVEAKPIEIEAVEVKTVEAKPAEVKSTDVEPIEVRTPEVKLVEVKPVQVKPVAVNPVEIESVEMKPAELMPIEPKPIEVHSVAAKPVETPVMALSPSPKVAEDQERQPKVTLVPIRKAASPSSPESPLVEKTTWSRWPYQPTLVTSIPPVKARVPLARDSVPIPTRSDSQAPAPRPSRVPPVSTMPPIIPITPVSAVSPSTPAKVDSAHPRRSHRPHGMTSPTPPTPVHSQDASAHHEKRERPVKRPSVTVQATLPTPNIPSVAFQSPRSSEDSLPAYTSQAPSVDRDPKPVPRGILKQRITPPITPPEVETPTAANPASTTPQLSKFEFTGSRNVPAYDDWGRAPSVRKDVSNNTSSARSREVQPPSAAIAIPHLSRSRTTGDSNHRSRSKRSSKELGSAPNKVNRPRTPSPSREPKTNSKITITPPKPNLVPVFNEKIIRTKVPKPAKISTTRTSGNIYIQPLTSPILLTSENYGARLPENSVYQYDGISPSEPLSPTTRKAIFDILQKQVAPQVFPVLARPSFDGKRMLYTQRRLNVSSRQEFSVELPEDGQAPQVYIVQLKRLAVITPQ
ncbi:hypothetical protein B0J17DRAFT_668419 [Rhizoctonia solani]|nr:hypothetical protein B0J17DRAFT_668419 [Rhizoctonia solani]